MRGRVGAARGRSVPARHPWFMKYGLQSLLFLPLVILSGCLSYYSRIDLHSVDSQIQGEHANAVESEVSRTLEGLGYQRRSVKDLTRMKQGRPDFVSAWIRDKNRDRWSRF